MRVGWIVLLSLVLAGCSSDTAQLSPTLTQRFAAEGILRRADDAVFRYTEGAGKSGGMWDEGRASIVVTKTSVFLHKGSRTLVEITASNGGNYSVRRDHNRVVIHTGTGRSGKSWSFQPPDEAEGWARDLRAVIRGTAADGE